jgi:hypothetical protein
MGAGLGPGIGKGAGGGVKGEFMKSENEKKLGGGDGSDSLVRLVLNGDVVAKADSLDSLISECWRLKINDPHTLDVVDTIRDKYNISGSTISLGGQWLLKFSQNDQALPQTERKKL